MVCAYCGTLNRGENERCIHCGRPMAASAEDMCPVHPDRLAVARCARCDAALCEECLVSVQANAYCAEHASVVSMPSADDYLRTTRVLDPIEHPVATFGNRVLAGLIDLALLGAWWLILFIVMWAMVGSPPTHPDAGGWRAVYWILLVLGSLGYLVYEFATSGRTVGMAVTDLIALRTDGTPMDFGTAIVRGILAALGFLLGGISFWAILWSPERRALHDRWTGTVVLQESGYTTEERAMPGV